MVENELSVGKIYQSCSSSTLTSMALKKNVTKMTESIQQSVGDKKEEFDVLIFKSSLNSYGKIKQLSEF